MSQAENRTRFGVRRLVCENKRFRVFLNELWEDGALVVKDYLVVEPKAAAADSVAGVAILPVIDGVFGLLRVFRPALGAPVWELPRGFVRSGESSASAAQRELEEETGLVCGTDGLCSLGLLAPEGGLLAARVHIYTATECHRARPFPGKEVGHDGFFTFTEAEMTKMIESNTIQDPGAIIAFYRYVARSWYRPSERRSVRSAPQQRIPRA